MSRSPSRPYLLLRLRRTRFRGYGYSPEYVLHLACLVERPQGSPRTVIQVVNNIVCGQCPFLGDGGCQEGNACVEKRVGERDVRVMAALALAPGQNIAWERAKRRLDRLTVDDQRRLCYGCLWQGYCYQDEGV
ncbi:MAG: DUF1284 domain-containing protein [Chloroflexi bacterium]|nr:DUF1284 domain-containing protein [Chloroflexota bacterium]